MNIVRRSQGSVRTIRFLQPSPSLMFPLKILIALVALLLMASVRAETNVTIDDTDPNIVYQPPGVWSFQGNVRPSFVQDRGRSLLLQTVFTQDRWNKTTHYTSELGATASLTFTVERSCPLTAGPLLIARLQGALYVYYIGYGIKEMPPPALVPITLQPQHGNAIAVQSDSYRPEGAQAQITLFTSNRLDPNETYTITVTKTNATLVHGVNIDSFILTQPDRADLTPSSPGTDFFSVSASTPDSPSQLKRPLLVSPLPSVLGQSSLL